MVSQCSLRLEARVDAGLLANACIVSTLLRGMPGYAKGSGKSMAECCGVLRSVYFGLQDVTCCEKTLFLFGSL